MEVCLFDQFQYNCTIYLYLKSADRHDKKVELKLIYISNLRIPYPSITIIGNKVDYTKFNNHALFIYPDSACQLSFQLSSIGISFSGQPNY